MMSLHPISGAAVLLVPALTALGVWTFVRRRRAVARALGAPSVARRITGVDLQAVPVGRVAAILLAALSLGAAAADPRWGLAGASSETLGGPVVLVVDVSNSMLAPDVAPNRLARARWAARQLVSRNPGRPIGIVAFAGRAFALTPPTADPAALDLYIGALHPQMVTQGGSSMLAAVRQGVGLLASGDEKGGAVLLLTDGDATRGDGELRDIARLARRVGIPIFAGGVGTTAGSPVPDIDLRTGERLGFKREADGAVAVSRLNDELLRELARESGGGYADLAADDAALAFLSRVGEASTGGAADGSAEAAPARFTPFAVGALFFLLLEAALRSRRREAPR